MDAVLIARGRIVGLPDDLLSPTQTIEVECAPADIDDLLLEWCKDNLADGPETDFLFSDADPESVETYLLGRSGTLRVDPATHEISYVDDLVGETIHDLAGVLLVDGDAWSMPPGMYDPPSKEYRAEITCDWTQEASGKTDIGAWIGSISSMDPSFGGRIEQALSVSGAEGWSSAGVEAVQRRTTGMSVGGTYAVYSTTLKPLVAWETGPFAEYVQFRGERADGVLENTTLRGTYAVFTTTVKRWNVQYSYSQARQERVFASLEVPVWDTVFVREKDPEVLRLSLGDIFVSDKIHAWLEDTDYVAGDRVEHDGRYYEAVADHRSSEYFDERNPAGETRRSTYESAIVRSYESTWTYWIRVYPDDIPSRAATYKWFDTPRGQRCIEHALCRLRKTGRRNLRARHIVGNFLWEDVRDVSVADSISVVVPWDGGTTGRRITAKVVTIEREWDGDRAVARIEAGISLGTGETSESPLGDVYADDWSDPDYAGAPGLAIREIEYVTDADPASRPIRAERLRYGSYAVESVDVGNGANAQWSIMSGLKDPAQAPVLKPTYLDIRLKSLATSDVLTREIDIAARLNESPMGIAQ
ncbi:hypothetical protein [Fulvimarina manganoxydans]|uniref:hypothetical protein n=1 Tax=Fulvimarina manganoxydans TaxID=937218 RepID=UPI00111C7118|nr:hypothetical protein [Fulvimarina manganoxydans]